jgi:hypothetical protein
MVLETETLSFDQWFWGALVEWLLIVTTLTVVASGVALLVLVLVGRHEGFDRAWSRFLARVGSAIDDLFGISPRRVWALARLTIQESIRRRGLVAFVLFLFVVLPVALWFLDTQSPDPAVLYISSMQWATTILVLITVLLLSAVSLPNDVKNKTIFTIVTKPVRASEIVLGRIVGIVAIGTVMLVVMGVLGYVFVHRALDHTHEIDEHDLTTIETPSSADVRAVAEGRTTSARGHRHRVRIDADGSGGTDVVQGHWHRVTARDHGGTHDYVVSGPQGEFRARVPLYGQLRFKDRFGHAAAKGTNVGEEWTYRSYIAGGTLAAAIWTFENIDAKDFPEGLRLDMNLQVFRTHKGDIERGVAGSIVLRNPRTQRSSAPYNFIAREFVVDQHFLPRRLADTSGASLDIFNDLVEDGRVEVVVQCLENGQFLGVAQPDVYLLAREGSVAANFAKTLAGTWLLMTLLVSIGVMWSTFLNAAIALLATVGTLFTGYFAEFIGKLSRNEVVGGGSIESLVRIAQQKNLLVPLEQTWSLRVVGAMDEAIRWVLWSLVEVVPDLRLFGSADYLAQGYDIPWNDVAIQAMTTAGYAIPVFIVGYLCFKFREVAQ